MYELAFLSGPRAGDVIPVTGTLVAGRSTDCSLDLPSDPSVSRHHARFLFDGADLTVADGLEGRPSANGTYVNDQRISAAPLAEGDVVRMGETRLRVRRRALSGSQPAEAIFAFKESEADLHGSIIMPVAQVAKAVAPGDVLQARLTSIMKISSLLVKIARLEEVLAGILEVLFDVFPQADRGFLMLGNDVASLAPKAVRTRAKGRSTTEGLTVSTTICRRALESRSAFLFNDQEGAGGFEPGVSVASLRIRSAMTIPLMVGDEVLGLLQIDTGDISRAFGASDLELAVSVSQQAAIALHNALLLERVERETVNRNNLLRFLPGPLADQVLSGSLDIALGGRTYKGTILFSDVIGFTRMSETMHSDAVVSLMNAYFDRVVPCIQLQQGAIDKFIGDAIMAFWGIPFDRGDSMLNAAQAGLAMQLQLAGFNSMQARDGKPVLGHGIGINCGEVVAGNVGSTDRLGYTLLGDAVNTASRIEHMACAGQVLLSRSAWEALDGRGHGLRLPSIMARNKAEPIEIWSLRGLRLDGDEVMVHVQARSGSASVVLIRRLADRSFVVLHPRDCDLAAATLVSASVDWPGVDLGRPEVVTVLPSLSSDGELARSQVRLTDPDLCGLLSGDALVSPAGWAQMTR